MPTARTDLILRLHTDKDGLVWYGDDDHPATNTCLDPWDFFENEAHLEELDNARLIRLLGTKDNSTLIVKLQERRLANPEFSSKVVQLGTPTVVPAKWLKNDPVSVLHHIWQPPVPASLSGCWHDMTIIDYATYAMINTLGGKPGREVPEVTKRIAYHHPAWTALTFVGSIEEDAACRLICDIVDPRWYRHPTHPSRQSRLHAHMGLTPENMQACAGEGHSGVNFNQATNAVRVWYNRAAQRETRDPKDFLLRILNAHPGNLSKGLLRGTQRLVEFVCSVWLDAVSRAHPELGFDPAQFFKDPKEARAFSQHRTSKRV